MTTSRSPARSPGTLAENRLSSAKLPARPWANLLAKLPLVHGVCNACPMGFWRNLGLSVWDDGATEPLAAEVIIRSSARHLTDISAGSCGGGYADFRRGYIRCANWHNGCR
jgi:hypothetical protein